MSKRCMTGAFCNKTTGEVGCKFWGSDMDLDPFCVHPKAMELSGGFGLNTRAMAREGLCKSDSFELHEPDTLR